MGFKNRKSVLPADEDFSPLMKSLRPTVTLSNVSTDCSESESEVFQSPAEKKRERFIRSRDRVIFVFHVLNLIMTSVLITRDAKYFAYWSSAVVTISIIHRIREFYLNNWSFYMVDFCYIANWIAIVFIVFFPQNELLFKACFAFSLGVLMFSVSFFRNTMAFHSTEKMTSLLIHFNPGLAMFLIRWHDTSKTFYPANAGTEEFGWNFIYTWYLAVGVIYFAWAAFYYVIIFVIFRNHIQKNKIRTLFSDTLATPRLAKMINIFGERWQSVMFMSIHWRLAMCLSTLTIALYYSYWLSLIWMISMHLTSIRNGASFYIEYHSTKYEKQFYTQDD